MSVQSLHDKTPDHVTVLVQGSRVHVGATTVAKQITQALKAAGFHVSVTSEDNAQTVTDAFQATPEVWPTVVGLDVHMIDGMKPTEIQERIALDVAATVKL